MYPNGVLCPRSNQLLNEISTEPAYVNYMKNLVPLQQNLSQILGIPLASLPDWSGIAVLLSVHGILLTAW